MAVLTALLEKGFGFAVKALKSFAETTSTLANAARSGAREQFLPTKAKVFWKRLKAQRLVSLGKPSGGLSVEAHGAG